MKLAFAVFLFIHGLAHGVGFLTVSGLVENSDQPSEPTFLLTGFASDHWVFTVMAVVWLIGLVGFVISGIGVLTGTGWTLTAIVAATVLSTILSLLWVKSAPLGIVVNLIVIAALLVPAVSDRVLPSV
jgi:hypothetical protein